MKKNFYVSWGYIGDSKYADRKICVCCTEDELRTVAMAIGAGQKADSLVIYNNPNQTKWDPPYKVYYDCM